MLPLGDRFTGLCRAVPDQPCAPREADLSACNLGYAREGCARFPRGDGPDAVRFTVAAAGAASLRLYYVLERDHHPYAHGPLEYLLPSGPFLALPQGEAFGDAFASQARAYAASYLRRTFAAASL